MKKSILIFFNVLSIFLLIFSLGVPIYNFFILKMAYVLNSVGTCDLSHGWGKDNCYYALELKNHNPEFCEKWFSLKNTEACYLRFAMKTQDSSRVKKLNTLHNANKIGN